MPSDSQISANRQNALKSTGPTSAKGKATVRWNALRHGAFSPSLLLPGENRAAFNRLRQAYLDLYQPSDPNERFLVDRMILAAWRLSRLASMEVRVIRAHRDAARNNAKFNREIFSILNPSNPGALKPQTDPVARAYMRDSEHGNTVYKFVRYQSMLERSYHRALRELAALRA